MVRTEDFCESFMIFALYPTALTTERPKRFAYFTQHEKLLRINRCGSPG